MLTPDDLVGTWHLLEWRSVGESAGNQWPMGPDALGQIIYSADGHMSAFLMRSDFADADTSASADSSLSYAGTWRYSDGVVTHLVQFSSLPSFVGRTLLRLATFRDDELTLETIPENSASGKTYQYSLRWQRAED